MTEASRNLSSWGRFHKVSAARVKTLEWRYQQLPSGSLTEKLLPYALGRSYGDSCLNSSHTHLLTQHLDRVLSFDRLRGILRCEAGLSLAAILELVLPEGWFLPVSPGTKWVSVGGAIANDVHGKNHHRAGNFGHHLREFELLRSDGQRLACSPTSNRDYFSATIGGLGLTGLITWAEIQLQPVLGPWIRQQTLCFANLEEFFTLSRQSLTHYAYTVAWIDSLAHGKNLGRGVFFQGNHGNKEDLAQLTIPRKKLATAVRTFPCDLPSWAFNRFSVGLFNQAYYRRQKMRGSAPTLVHYEPFFYPLDAVHHWNRMYGGKGFFQYQCVLPFAEGHQALGEMLRVIAQSGMGSFLAVLKEFGEIPSLGLLSFPRPGVTLALDFANRGAPLLALLDRLDAITRAAGGSVYPAKDARMSGEDFRCYFPRWEEFLAYIDPRFSSDFWRRVMEK